MIAEYVENTASGRTMVDGSREVEDFEKTAENKAIERGFVDDVLMGGKVDKVTNYISTEQYDQHNPEVEDGLEGFSKHLKKMMASGAATEYVKVHHLIGQGNFVILYSHTRINGDDYAIFDIFRLKDSKMVEHWDVQEKISPRETWNNSDKF